MKGNTVGPKLLVTLIKTTASNRVPRLNKVEMSQSTLSLVTHIHYHAHTRSAHQGQGQTPAESDDCSIKG